MPGQDAPRLPLNRKAARLAEQPAKQTGDQRQYLAKKQIADPRYQLLEKGTKVDHGSVSA